MRDIWPLETYIFQMDGECTEVQVHCVPNHASWPYVT